MLPSQHIWWGQQASVYQCQQTTTTYHYLWTSTGMPDERNAAWPETPPLSCSAPCESGDICIKEFKNIYCNFHKHIPIFIPIINSTAESSSFFVYFFLTVYTLRQKTLLLLLMKITMLGENLVSCLFFLDSCCMAVCRHESGTCSFHSFLTCFWWDIHSTPINGCVMSIKISTQPAQFLMRCSQCF